MIFIAGLALLLLGSFSQLFTWIGIGLVAAAYLLPYASQIQNWFSRSSLVEKRRDLK